MKPKNAVVAGHICLDVIPDLTALPTGKFNKLFQPGHLISVGEADFYTGGPVSNVGLALHRLGIPTQLIAKIGNDPFGRAVRRIITGIDEQLVSGIRIHESAPTSYSIIVSPPGIDRIFLHCPGVNDIFGAEDIDFAMVGQADLFHFGYPPIMKQIYQNEGDELVAIFQRAKQTQVTTSLDMAFPTPDSEGANVNWGVILKRVLPFVDLFMPSIEEILFLVHRDRYERLVTVHGDVLNALTPDLLTDLSCELLGMGAKMVVLKLGHHGLFLHTSSRDDLAGFGRGSPSDLSIWADVSLWAPCFVANVVGTTGAGDATIAGFLSALLRDLPPKETITAAVAVGACNVERADALSGLCSWDETQLRILQGWTRCPIEIQHPRWQWETDHQIWSAI